eukprot:gene7836-biopygen18075
MPDTIQEWHAQEVNLQAFLEHFGAKVHKTHFVLMGATKKTRDSSKCRKSCRVPSMNGMPRMSFTSIWSVIGIKKTTKIASKHAPQRRVYARSVQQGPIDGTHGCAQKWYFQFPLGTLLDRAHVRKMRFEGCARNHRKSSKMQKIMPDTIQEWHAEDVILKHLWSIFWSIPETKTTKIASKHAPQRRVYARSVQKGPIDGTHGCTQKMVFPVPTGEAVRPSARPKDAFFSNG